MDTLKFSPIDKSRFQEDKKYNRIIINSQDREAGDATEFRIRLDNPIYNLKTLEITSCVIPNTIYTFTSSNNKLIFDEGAPVTITITPGTYSITDLITELNTQILASALAGVYTITYSPTTLKLNISCTVPFQLVFLNQANTAWFELGFTYNTDTAIGVSLTAPRVLALDGPKFVMIRCGNLDNVGVNTRNTQFLFSVPMDVPFTDVKYYEPNTREETLMTFNYGLSPSYFDFIMIDDNNNKIDLNGSEISFILTYTTY